MPGRNWGSQDTKERFTGKEHDETGMDYFGARYYAAGIGRWMGVDPMAEDYASWSPYNYTLNNPVRLTDPNGKTPIIPLLLKMTVAAAADYAAQTAMNYYFNPRTAGDLDASSGAVNGWQVARSGVEGLIPWKTPGGRLGRAAGTALGDVLVNYLADPDGYTDETFIQDFATGFVGDLVAGGLGEIVSKYGSKSVAGGLSKLPGFDAGKIRQLTGHDIIGDYANNLANTIGGSVRSASGDGKTITNGLYTVRIMYKGGRRNNPYFRVSKEGKGAIGPDGNFSDDRDITHMEFTGDPSKKIAEIINNNGTIYER